MIVSGHQVRKKEGNGLVFENYKLCGVLDWSDTCIVVEQYEDGARVRAFHEHVHKRRLSNVSRIHLLRALVTHFSCLGPEAIVRCHLNRNGRTPAADNRLRMHSRYSEPGVLRTYCGTYTLAWSDQVIAPSDFRNTEGSAIWCASIA